MRPEKRFSRRDQFGCSGGCAYLGGAQRSEKDLPPVYPMAGSVSGLARQTSTALLQPAVPVRLTHDDAAGSGPRNALARVLL